MLTDNQMTAGRYLRWAKARKMIREIQNHLRSGGVVVLATYTHGMQFDARHVEMFKAGRNGAFRRAGKSWVCIDGCAIRFYLSRTTTAA